MVNEFDLNTLYENAKLSNQSTRTQNKEKSKND